MPEMRPDETPLVTVITVSYNSALYIRDAIESVLNQDYRNIEYIIIDDCSPDNTWDIIQEYSDPRIKAVRNQSNLGEYPNRNQAIDLATGEYLIFIDGDDMVLSHGIEYFTRLMQRFPEAAMAVQINYLNNVIFPVLLPPVEVLKNYFFGEINLLSSSFTSNFFRTRMLKSQKMVTHLKSGDEEIRFRIAMQHPTLFVAGWVSWPRETPGSASTGISRTLRLQELLYISRNAFYSTTIDKKLLNDVEGVVRRMISRHILKLAAAMQFSEMRSLANVARLSLFELAKYVNYKPLQTDLLSHYTPADPFKQEKSKLK
jgi:glycosyltransferase involved in cell wall biosynthesis